MYGANREAELEMLIFKLQKELAVLEYKMGEPKQEVTYNAGDGKVGYYSVGNNYEAEIKRIKQEIYDYRQEINKIKEERKENAKKEPFRLEQAEKEKELKKAEKLKEKEQNELAHKANFQRVKGLYKGNTNFLERVVRKIQGKGIKKEKEYTAEELEFLIRTFYGSTAVKRANHHKDVNAFLRMVSKDGLKTEMKAEEVIAMSSVGHSRR